MPSSRDSVCQADSLYVEPIPHKLRMYSTLNVQDEFNIYNESSNYYSEQYIYLGTYFFFSL